VPRRHLDIHWCRRVRLLAGGLGHQREDASELEYTRPLAVRVREDQAEPQPPRRQNHEHGARDAGEYPLRPQPLRSLDALREDTESGTLSHAARCRTLYGKFAEFVDLVDPEAPDGQTRGIKYQIDDRYLEP
jgi:hypothetical protein